MSIIQCISFGDANEPRGSWHIYRGSSCAVNVRACMRVLETRMYKVDHHWAAFQNLCSCVLVFARPQDGWGGAGTGRFQGKVSSAGTWHPPPL